MSSADNEDSDGSGRVVLLRRALLRYLRRRTGGDDDEEDLVQDVFARVSARRRDEPVEHLRGYAYRTADSVLADRGRRRAARRQDRHVEFDADRHAENDFDPDRILAGKQDLQRALQVLEALPERTRTIFILFRMEGMAQRDIANRFGISVSAVEKHMIRAMQQLAAAMKDRP